MYVVYQDLTKGVSTKLISQQVETMALYSASTENREVVVCFFLFQEICDSPSRMQYHD
jgi:hypothetical protein